MAKRPLFAPLDFRMEPNVVYACAGGETPFLRTHDEAFARYVADKGHGYSGRIAMGQHVLDTRAKVARLWQTTTDQIGFTSSVAEAMSMLVESLELGPGDSIVVEEQEYPSIVLPLVMLGRRRGFTIRLAPDEQSIEALVDETTRLIGTSHVSYLNGKKADLGALRAVADRVGAILVADFTQSAGNTVVAAEICDFAFSSCYKWLLGTTGVAVAFWNRKRRPDWRPTTAGWHSVADAVVAGRPTYADGVMLKDDAMCFARGNPAHLPIYILNSALDYLGRYGTGAIDAHIHTLTVAMLERLRGRGLPVITPYDPSRHGASVAFDSGESDKITHALADRGILVWGGRNRVRISFHGYNSLGEIDAIDAALGDVI